MTRISVEQHRRDVEDLLGSLGGTERRSRPAQVVPLAEALDRVLAADLHAPVDLPLFRNSQMDGFAVRAADVAGAGARTPVTLPVTAEVAAAPGRPAALAQGSAARIMTGAPVPDGADAVVPVEDTGDGSFSPGAPRPGDPTPHVQVRAARVAGEFVRAAGSDVRAGDLLLPAGTVLAPHLLAAAAACGVDRLGVVAPPRVAVVSTGSELVAPGTRPGPGQVFDANLVALGAAVRRAGGLVVGEHRTGDDADELARVLAEAAAASDLVLTSGGVSQGAYEVVKDVLGGAGDVVFRSVAMQPGGPQGLGRVHGTPILTFPGNPVSAQVSFVVFARDAVTRAAGRVPAPRSRAVLDGEVSSPAGRRQLLRGVRSGDGTVRVVGGPGSHLVASMARADVLVDVPADVTRRVTGDEVEVWEL
ncbi:gephyrin-like molybdotransferase Glp [Oerskovia flava]|uniref:molybdopterin molybdotransferase MoeA n=1 Tax=Oerskovia flava TaxID=2986422 RepID=UPI00223ED999|nr:gephyrin-like molybdotransferase Glp [Oerskovia sp. JB1-3-2]